MRTTKVGSFAASSYARPSRRSRFLRAGAWDAGQRPDTGDHQLHHHGDGAVDAHQHHHGLVSASPSGGWPPNRLTVRVSYPTTVNRTQSVWTTETEVRTATQTENRTSTTTRETTATERYVGSSWMEGWVAFLDSACGHRGSELGLLEPNPPWKALTAQTKEFRGLDANVGTGWEFEGPRISSRRRPHRCPRRSRPVGFALETLRSAVHPF